jgi:AcrR family transcriptional regulator
MTEHPDTRTQIVQAGVELVDEAGLSEVGVRSIARRAGVSHGAPRRYFPTHRSLLSAIASAGLSDLKAAMASAYTAGDTTVRDQLSALAHAYVEFAQQRPGMFELLFRHDLLAGGGENLRDETIPLLGAVEKLISDITGADEPRQRALQFWTSVHGIAILTATHALEVFDADVTALIVAAVDVQVLPLRR